MPIFEYKCSNCNNIFEVLTFSKHNNGAVCKQCGSKEVHKIISSVGIIFKGSGFYVTDNKSSKKSTVAESESTSTPAAETKTEAGESPTEVKETVKENKTPEKVNA